MCATERCPWAAIYRFSFTESKEGIRFKLTDLENDERLLSFLGAFGESVQSPALQVTGSLFVKRYGLFVCGAMHCYMRCREAVDLSPERVQFVWSANGLQFAVESAEEPEFLRGLTDDAESRTRYFDHVFADQACRVLRRVAQVTRINEGTLWGNLSYGLAYWKNEWLQEAALSDAERGRIEDDFRELLVSFRLQRFPHLQANPLTTAFRSVSNPHAPGKPIMVRSKCCLNYCLPGGDRYCYTCPRITDEKRIDKYIEAHKPNPIQAKEVLSTTK